MPFLAQFLRTLPELEPTVEGHNQFSANGNCLRIDYGARDDIVVSLQSEGEVSETQIHISPSRIKVAAKYSILNNELYEDGNRDATGARTLAAPAAAAHVLLNSNTLFQSTVCLMVNDTKYFMEWHKLFCPDRRWSVVV